MRKITKTPRKDTYLMYIANEVVGPVFLIIALGYLFNRLSPIDVRSLTRLFLYLLSPALIFTSLLQADIGGRDYIFIVLFALAMAAGLLAISWLVGRSLGWKSSDILSVQLGTTFINAGNIGLPLLYFALGPEGVHIGAVFLLIHSLLHYSLGIFLCARNNAHRGALQSIFRLPMPYAALAAIIIKATSLPLPAFIWEGTNFIGESAVALGALILGIQLSKTRLIRQWPQIGVNAILRLLVGPLMAFLLVGLLPLDPLSSNALVLQAATPSSITIVIIATEFDSQPALVSSLNLSTTALSLFTLPLILHLLIS